VIEATAIAVTAARKRPVNALYETPDGVIKPPVRDNTGTPNGSTAIGYGWLDTPFARRK
jgi:hypothetical protein